MKLIGGLTINGKTFDKSDSIGKVYRNQLGLDDTFYGGSVKEFYKTEYGIYICLDKRENPINICHDEEKLTDEGRKLLGMEVTEKPIEELSRKELISKAKGLGIPGKLATMSTEDLIREIKECL